MAVRLWYVACDARRSSIFFRAAGLEPFRVPRATHNGKRPTFGSAAIVPALGVEPLAESARPSRTRGGRYRSRCRSVVDRLSPRCDPIQPEWVTGDLPWSGAPHERAYGCFCATRENRCETRHEKGNGTRISVSPCAGRCRSLPAFAAVKGATKGQRPDANSGLTNLSAWSPAWLQQS